MAARALLHQHKFDQPYGRVISSIWRMWDPESILLAELCLAMMRLPKAKHKCKYTNLFRPCPACRSKVHVLAKECNFCGFIVRRKLSESATRDRVSPSGRRQWKEAEKSRLIPSAELACVVREDVSSEQQTAQQHSPGLVWYENTSISTDSTRRGQIQGMHSEEQQGHQKQITSADQQEQDAEEEFFLGLISSPDRIRVRETWTVACFPCRCDCVCIILQRITKQLRKLQFCNPGPQMRSHATDS